IQFRMGITTGDVVSDGKSIYGDAVAVASRLESLAEPGGINVSRAVRDHVRDRLSIILRDLGEHEVPNVPRPVRVFAIARQKEDGASTTRARRRTAAPLVRPAMAVLPFQNLGGDTETEFFLDGVAEDLITELSRARWFSVVARNAAFAYKGKDASAQQVGRELGVRYVLEGHLREGADGLCITSQLVEAESGQPLWSEQ